MKYVYFISYVYEQNNWNRFCYCEIALKNEIKKLKHIDEVAIRIEESRKLTGVNIINYQLLRTEK